MHNPVDTKISVSVKADDLIKISIQDNGRGMSAEEMDKLFVRYYRGNNTDAKPEGSGMGMTIAKQIIEQHAGWILAESQLGSGMCITIALPAQS